MHEMCVAWVFEGLLSAKIEKWTVVYTVDNFYCKTLYIDLWQSKIMFAESAGMLECQIGSTGSMGWMEVTPLAVLNATQ